MKFTKTYGIFLSAFSIGCLFALAPKLFIKNDANYGKHTGYTKSEIVSITYDLKPKLEIIEQEDNWINEEGYPHKMRLLETGLGFHGDEVKAKSGEKWLGLFQDGDKFVLKSTKLKIKRVHDGITDDEETGNKTGKEVKVNEDSEPIFLLKNSGLKSREVQTIFRGNRYEEMPEDSDLSYDEFLTSMYKGFFKEFKFSGKNYSLKVIEALNKDNEKIFALVLEGLGKRQVLHSVDAIHNEGTLGTLYWIGDLDGDEKPDFYMTPSVHYNVKNRVLFLSSKANKNNLLGKVAYFWTTGC